MSTIYFSPTIAIQMNEPSGTLIIGVPGAGKEIANSERILTPKGFTTVGNIKVGDFLIGKNGKRTKVLEVYPHKNKDIYEFKTSDGRVLRCGKEHLFTVGTTIKGETKWQDLTVEEMLNIGIYKGKQLRFFIPNNGCIEYNKRKLTVNPYILGAFLGNSVANALGLLEIFSKDSEVPKKIAKLLSSEMNKNVIQKEDKNNVYHFYFKDTGKTILAKNITKNPILIALLTNTSIKYIPEEYKFCSVEQRYELVRGLLDTAVGNINKNFAIECSLDSKQLVDDLKDLLRSLGNIHIIENTPKIKKDNIIYKLKINCDNVRKKDFFTHSEKLSRAKKAPKTNSDKYTKIGISSIELTEDKEDTTCFFVDAKDHLYIAGDTVVTHNTFFATNVAANEIACGKRVLAIDPKDDFMNLKNIWPDVKIVNVNNIAPGSLNPFMFLKNCDSLTLKTIIEIIVGGISDNNTNSKLNGILQDFVVRFNRDGAEVQMQDVIDYLYRNTDDGIRNLASELQVSANSQYGSLLFTRTRGTIETVNIGETDNVVFSLLGLPFPNGTKDTKDYTAEENFTTAIVYIIARKLREALSENSSIPTTLFCDEAHILFSNPQLANTLNNFLTMGRSLNMATVLASQSVKHFPENISQFIANKFVFKSSKEEAEAFLNKFDTSSIDPTTEINRANTVMSIANLENGHCFYMDSKSRSGIIHIISNFDAGLLSSNALEKLNRNKEE